MINLERKGETIMSEEFFGRTLYRVMISDPNDFDQWVEYVVFAKDAKVAKDKVLKILTFDDPHVNTIAGFKRRYNPSIEASHMLPMKFQWLNMQRTAEARQTQREFERVMKYSPQWKKGPRGEE